MSNIRVRIAPSPTGPLHIGTARTALFNYLFARHLGGKFIIRIEDTDLLRSDPKFEKNILEGLEWLGIEADESPIVGGPDAPYRQTERIESYAHYLKKLLAEGKVFYCFHTEAELEEEKRELLETKHSPIHLCEYRTMDIKEAETLAEINSNYVIRFKTPAGRIIAFNDLIRGELSFQSDLLGDFSVAKKIDVPLYHFAVVVDDEAMDITHVIRGEDHIANTPKHILLIEALGFCIPQYAHLPLVLGTDRSKLSKRHGATSIDEYREQGYLPEALFNFLALLGWNPGDNREILSKEELIREFSIEKIQKAGAVFDFVKLDWMNGEYIRKKTSDELTRIALPFIETLLSGKQFSLDYITKVIALEQPRLKKLSELLEKIDYFFEEPQYDVSLLLWKKMTAENAVAALDVAKKLLEQNKEKPITAMKEIFLQKGKEMGDKGSLLWPLRVALSGKKASPDPFEIMEILGIEKAARRIEYAKKIAVLS
ncbi:MAG: glutamate--tRNA ligase [Candidatus Sungbacteria bacterium]|nr:glutamate--tRNA ligase [Candidatus Sungbacteria bacterium]